MNAAPSYRPAFIFVIRDNIAFAMPSTACAGRRDGFPARTWPCIFAFGIWQRNDVFGPFRLSIRCDAHGIMTAKRQAAVVQEISEIPPPAGGVHF